MIASLLPASVTVVEQFEDIPGEEPFPGEEDLIAGAVEVRRREFVTARRCARQALEQLGHAAAPLRSGPRREPLWPPGIVGSITHCTGFRAAAVARRIDLAGLGIDAEPHASLPAGVEASVAGPAERARLRELEAAVPQTHWGRVLFSAKESVYKAWYPLTGRRLGFEDADLHIDPRAGSFRARLLVDGSRAGGGRPLTEIRGRFAVGRGLIVTAAQVHRRHGRTGSG
ncbi:4'-phosphopantetheinyl transferase superfamily protein [Actinoplanes sp. NPDC023936]|uniref:4'-phosphopantetheinyl transferase family protein n=1 Tax=Actinoplanes sp. NPDC023936 TaxID=3154910 RepID=UPI0033D8F4D1